MEELDVAGYSAVTPTFFLQSYLLLSYNHFLAFFQAAAFVWC